MIQHNRVERLLTLLPWLLNNPESTTSEIALKFGVTENQLLQDLALLTFVGPSQNGGELDDIQYEAGGFINVVDTQGLDQPLNLSQSEGLYLAAVLVALGPEIPDYLQSDLAFLIEKLVPSTVSNSNPVKDISDNHNMYLLEDAIRVNRAVRFEYLSITNAIQSSRLVSPKRLRVQSQAIYLDGYCHDTAEGRTYRLDRITAVNQVSDPYMSGPLNMKHRDLITVSGRIKSDYIWMFENMPNLTTVNEGDYSQLNFGVYHIEFAISLALQCIGFLDLNYPENVMTEVSKRADQLLTTLS